MTPTATLLVGRGGLLGGAMAAQLGLPTGRTGVDWTEPARARRQLVDLAHATLDEADGGSWTVYWCAGTGFVGASPSDLALEAELLRALLGELAPAAPNGRFVLTSSAGAVHAGGPNPATERSVPTPISQYGTAKLEQEAIVRGWTSEHGGRAAIARLSNLYGPGQNLAKPQGLISRLVLASLLDRPLTIFVPLETSRDYLYVADAARALEAVAEALDEVEPGTAITKLVASGRLTTVGSIVAELGRIRKKRPPIVFASTASTELQPRALAFRSQVLESIDDLARTPLPEGIGHVLRSQLAAVADGSLHRSQPS